MVDNSNSAGNGTTSFRVGAPRSDLNLNAPEIVLQEVDVSSWESVQKASREVLGYSTSQKSDANVNDTETPPPPLDPGYLASQAPDLLFLNAGIVVGSSLVHEVSPNHTPLNKLFGVNLYQLWHLTGAFLPHMYRKKNWNRVFIISSAAGLSGNARMSDYCASKAATVSVFESLQSEMEEARRRGDLNHERTSAGQSTPEGWERTPAGGFFMRHWQTEMEKEKKNLSGDGATVTTIVEEKREIQNGEREGAGLGISAATGTGQFLNPQEIGMQDVQVYESTDNHAKSRLSKSQFHSATSSRSSSKESMPMTHTTREVSIPNPMAITIPSESTGTQKVEQSPPSHHPQGHHSSISCVLPYKINTNMFQGASQQANSLLLPFLEPDYVVNQIIEQTVLQDVDFLAMPRFVYLTPVLKTLLPLWVKCGVASKVLGIDKMMDGFRGEGGGNSKMMDGFRGEGGGKSVEGGGKDDSEGKRVGGGELTRSVGDSERRGDDGTSSPRESNEDSTTSLSPTSDLADGTGSPDSVTATLTIPEVKVTAPVTETDIMIPEVNHYLAPVVGGPVFRGKNYEEISSSNRDTSGPEAGINGITGPITDNTNITDITHPTTPVELLSEADVNNEEIPVPERNIGDLYSHYSTSGTQNEVDSEEGASLPTDLDQDPEGMNDGPDDDLTATRTGQRTTRRRAHSVWEERAEPEPENGPSDSLEQGSSQSATATAAFKFVPSEGSLVESDLPIPNRYQEELSPNVNNDIPAARGPGRSRLQSDWTEGVESNLISETITPPETVINSTNQVHVTVNESDHHESKSISQSAALQMLMEPDNSRPGSHDGSQSPKKKVDVEGEEINYLDDEAEGTTPTSENDTKFKSTATNLESSESATANKSTAAETPVEAMNHGTYGVGSFFVKGGPGV